jgi:hypothetical protein
MRISWTWLPLLVLVAACGGPEAGVPEGSPERRKEGPEGSPERRRTAPADLDPAERERFEAARAAAQRLFERLGGRLLQAVSEGGPAAAIDVCRSAAPAIADEVSAERGLRIGRTSHRLRSPANAPPDWAAELVRSLPEDPEAAGPWAFRLGDGRLGVTLPIRAKKMCLTCHGDREAMPGEVRAAIASAYPDDRATGFREGDLRGIFWVVVPGKPPQGE